MAISISTSVNPCFLIIQKYVCAPVHQSTGAPVWDYKDLTLQIYLILVNLSEINGQGHLCYQQTKIKIRKLTNFYKSDNQVKFHPFQYAHISC